MTFFGRPGTGSFNHICRGPGVDHIFVDAAHALAAVSPGSSGAGLRHYRLERAAVAPMEVRLDAAPCALPTTSSSTQTQFRDAVHADGELVLVRSKRDAHEPLPTVSEGGAGSNGDILLGKESKSEVLRGLLTV